MILLLDCYVLFYLNILLIVSTLSLFISMKRGLNRAKSVLILNSFENHSIFKRIRVRTQQDSWTIYLFKDLSRAPLFLLRCRPRSNVISHVTIPTLTWRNWSWIPRAWIAQGSRSIDIVRYFRITAWIDASRTYSPLIPRAFTPWTRRTHLESLIQSLTSPRAFLNRFQSLSLASSLPPSPSPFLFLFHSFHFLPLFLFPPFVTPRHWTWLGLVNGIFSVALFVAKLNGTRDYVLRRRRRENKFDRSIGKFVLRDFNKHSRIWICFQCPFVDGFSLERDWVWFCI